MKCIKISVIVPVYNTEAYLHKCIDSILNQSFTNFELLLVDDGSTDKSGQICDEYAKNDSRIKVFHKNNEGISATREFAIQHATGDYIQFIDSDDWIEPNMIEEMFNGAIATNSDIVGCNFIQEFPDRSLKTKAFYTEKDTFIQSVVSNYWGVLWKILFRRILVIDNDIHFPKNVDGGEDYYYVVNLLLNARKIFCINKFFYHYNRANVTSFISKPSMDRVLYQVKATELVEDLLIKYGKRDLYYDEICQRKSVIKMQIMRIHFLKGCSYFKEIDKWYIYKGNSVKNKMYLLISYLMNLICKIDKC